MSGLLQMDRTRSQCEKQVDFSAPFVSLYEIH
jgi:hypothetical protein